MLVIGFFFGTLFAGAYLENRRWVFGKTVGNTLNVPGTVSPAARMWLERMKALPQSDPVINAALFGAKYVQTVDPVFGELAAAWLKRIYEAESERQTS